MRNSIVEGQMWFEGCEPGKKTIKAASFAVRVNERIAKYGVETITEGEIMSLLTGIPIEKLNDMIASHGVIGLGRMIEGLDITNIQKRKLAMVFEISRKIGASKIKDNEMLDSSSKSGEYFMSLLSTKYVEEFVVAFLNSQNMLIKTEIASRGTINEAPIFPREIVKMAILSNAVSVILAHNHPGGSIKPSSSDIEATKKIKQALDTVNIKVIDHIIVGGTSYMSFAESGLL